MDYDVGSLLNRHLYPRLSLRDLQAVRQACRALRRAVTHDTWVKVASSALPEEHPLCSAEPHTPGPERADQLAKLHANLRAGSVDTDVAQLSLAGHGSIAPEGLRATANPQGTVVISEADYQLYVHEVHISSVTELRQIVKLPSPEPKPEKRTDHYCVASWAHDGSAVILQYQDSQPNRWQACYQAVYVLEVPSWGMNSIMRVHGKAAAVVVYSAAWSTDSTLVLVPHQGDAGCFLRVHTRSGQLLADIRIPDLLLGHGRQPSWAYAAHGRVAVARQDDFVVWQLPAGQLQDTAGPGAVGKAAKDGGRIDSLIAASPTGTKLAFLAARTKFLHIFDALTLTALATFSPAGRAGAAAQGDKRFGMVWSVYGWLMLSGPWSQWENDKLASVHAHTARAHSSKYALTLRHGHPSDQQPALSPDGAFLCVCACEPRVVSIKFYRVSSGQLMVTQDVRLPEGVYCHDVHQVLHWSSCGSQILVRLFAFDMSVPGGISDRLLIMRIL